MLTLIFRPSSRKSHNSFKRINQYSYIMVSNHKNNITISSPCILNRLKSSKIDNIVNIEKTNVKKIIKETNIDKYERKTPHEHVLLRPGMYLGQIEPSITETWIYNDKLKKMVKQTVVFSPALIKLFDEIIVNAADNKQRDKNMTFIEVNVDQIKNKDKDKYNDLKITVKNNGKGIPIVLHSTENMYIPELIFGHLLTGSNFDDSLNRVTGGRHGYGAKLTNIFSHVFEIETYDHKKNMLYSQKWEKNMTISGPPIIEKITLASSVGDYTKISFIPDLERFHFYDSNKSNYKAAIDDIITMLKRRTLDISACMFPVQVSYNNIKSPVSNFLEYVNLYCPNEVLVSDNNNDDNNDGNDNNDNINESKKNKNLDNVFYSKVNDRWEIALKLSQTGTFEHMSFVNSIWTSRGGSHVVLVSNQIVNAIVDALDKRNIKCTSTAIRNKLMLFVKCSVENPSFDSQSKETLTSRPNTFGSDCVLSKSFIKQFIKDSGIIEILISDILSKEQNKLIKASTSSKQNSSQVVDVPKLEDAHLAGTNKSSDCVLILTEGDSAKALAVAGLEVVGREKYGVLPLRGKILNVRVANHSQLVKNVEIINLCKSIGLDFSKTYEGGIKNQGLRYGSVMIMCDQDNDGSHIKGLIINFFHHFWPNLLQIDGFLQQFITPLVKVKTLKSGRGINKVNSFYSIPEYDSWKKKQINEEGNNNYEIKYYKGLGTNTAEEGKSYFKLLDKHQKIFIPGGNEDDTIDLAFSKTRSEDRKNWITNKFKADSFIDPNKTRLTYEEFIDTELIQFSQADNHRSIPSSIDGLKPAQRKVLYGCFKKNLTNDVKVVQLAGYIAEQTAYHHGEVSLHSTIVNMAQDYVGSNNTPLLEPSGQFGTRAQGGKDFASPRYIYTKLSPIARALFPSSDDGILEYMEEDGQIVEPKYFLPVIPAVLLNGCNGIGTGWSTSIPSYNIVDICEYITNMINGKVNEKKMIPWVRGFKGEMIEKDKTGLNFISRGIVKRISTSTIEVTELPIGKWTNDYKEMLCTMLIKGEIKGFTEEHTTDKAKFVIKIPQSLLDEYEKSGLIEAMKLESPLSLSNMHAFNSNGNITKYSTPEDFIQEFYPIRLNGYVRRKKAMLSKLIIEEKITRCKSQFVNDILSGELSIINHGNKSDNKLRNEYDIIQELKNRKYYSNIDENNEIDKKNNGFDYLLSMPINSLTQERSDYLKNKSKEAKNNLNILSLLTPEDLWLKDIENLLLISEKYNK